MHVDPLLSLLPLMAASGAPPEKGEDWKWEVVDGSAAGQRVGATSAQDRDGDQPRCRTERRPARVLHHHSHQQLWQWFKLSLLNFFKMQIEAAIKLTRWILSEHSSVAWCVDVWTHSHKTFSKHTEFSVDSGGKKIQKRNLRTFLYPTFGLEMYYRCHLRCLKMA